MGTNEPDQTRLDSPPADPSVAHTSPPPGWYAEQSANEDMNARTTPATSAVCTFSQQTGSQTLRAEDAQLVQLLEFT